MRSRPSREHAETVARRLEALGAEFRTAAPDPRPVTDDGHTHLRAVPPLAPVPDPGGTDAPVSATRPAHTGAGTGQLLAGPEPSPSIVRGPEESPDPPTLPVPGRHAHRGSGRLLDLSAFRGRAGLGPAHVAVVAVVAAIGLALTAWWVLRDDPGELAPAPTTAAPLVTPSSGAAPSTATEVVVDVAGKVRRPGIVVLEPGARVVDALEAAGGPRKGVELTGLNLARLLVDGEQIVVGVKPPPGVAASAAPSPGATATTLVNLNTATLAELEALSGVGPVTAQAIIDWRTDNGGFRSVEQLLEVDGIGEKTLADLAPHVTLG